MKKVDLQAQPRQETGKGAARKLRAQGYIPAILYGGDKPPMSISLPRRELALVMQGHEGRHLLVDLTVEDKGQGGDQSLAFLQELDVNPVSQIIEHADFWRVDATKPIHTTIPVHVTGLPIGVRQGGVLQQVIREIDIEALPIDIPEHIDVDVSSLVMGQSVHVSDLVYEGMAFTILTPADRVVSGVHAPRAITVEAGPAAVAEAPVADAAATEGKKES